MAAVCERLAERERLVTELLEKLRNASNIDAKMYYQYCNCWACRYWRKAEP